MIITKTPVRITFFGGGTDYPEYFQENGGRTLGASINHYTYVLLRRLAILDPYKYRLIYAQSELCHDVHEIKQPVIRETLLLTEVLDPLEIHYIADLPSFSGLGTSSSFAVCLLNAVNQYMGVSKSKIELAKDAIHLERSRLKEMVGVQDQFTCALGGLVRLEMKKDSSINPVDLHISKHRMENLNDHLMLFFTGVTRYAHQILPEQIEKTVNGINNPSLEEMAKLVDEGTFILENEQQDIRQFGELLHRGWVLKRGLSSAISNAIIDKMYALALKSGAIGGKLLGAGGGGFLLLFVPPEKQNSVRNVLSEYKSVDFKFESLGTHRVALDL